MYNRYLQLKQWYEERDAREQFLLLALSIVIIITLWNYALWKPLQRAITKNSFTIASLKNEIAIFKRQTDNLKLVGPKQLAEQQSRKASLTAQERKLASMKFNLESVKDNEKLLQTIFNPLHHPQAMELKSGNVEINQSEGARVSTQQKLEITFQNDYFDTLGYLKDLEKLPWCLAFDSFDYKVQNYPLATVLIALQIVNA